MKRILIVGGVVLVAVVVLAVWYVLSNLNSLVASAIEKEGTHVAGVPVHVGSVSIDLRAGRGTIRGLRVANPEGFSRGDAFSLGEITLQLDTTRLGSTPLVVQRVLIKKPVARYEVNARGESNFGVLKSHVEQASASKGEQKPKPAGGKPLKLVIRNFTFEQGSVHADFSALDAKQPPLEAELPRLHRSNLGAPSGATPDRIGRDVLTAFTGTVVKTVAADQAARELERKVGGEAGKTAGGLLKKVLQ